jgi:hypothetical protein
MRFFKRIYQTSHVRYDDWVRLEIGAPVLEDLIQPMQRFCFEFLDALQAPESPNLPGDPVGNQHMP